MKVSVRARIALLGLLAGSAAAWPEDMHRRQESSTSTPVPTGSSSTGVVSASSSSGSSFGSTSTSSSNSGSASTTSSSNTSTGSATSSLTTTTSDTSPSAPRNTSTLAARPPLPSAGNINPCHHPSAPFIPFCEPTNGSDVFVGDTPYVTWDPSYFLANSTITILLNYAEPDSNGKINQAWESPRLRNTYGFVAIPMDNNWLQDRSRNNLTLEIVAMDPMPGAQAIRRRGPTISLTKKPPNHPQPPPRVKTSKLGLYVGLPLALLAIVVILGAVCLGVRRTRRLGFANVMKGAGRRKGYGVGQSHRQRMRTAGGSKGIQLDDTHHHQRTPSDGTGDLHYADNDDGGFTDEPTHGVPVDSHNQGGQKNAFREEIERQRTGTK